METVQELSKSELFKKNLMEGFFIFEKGEFPALTGTEYDPIIFSIVNSAYAENSARFFATPSLLLMPYAIAFGRIPML